MTPEPEKPKPEPVRIYCKTCGKKLQRKKGQTIYCEECMPWPQ